MMKGCAEATRAHGIKTMVSLNPVMVDGTGMCGGCRVKIGDQIKFACVDGPDFDGHQVDFDDLMARLGRYKPTETGRARSLAGEPAACAAAADTPEPVPSDAAALSRERTRAPRAGARRWPRRRRSARSRRRARRCPSRARRRA